MSRHGNRLRATRDKIRRQTKACVYWPKAAINTLAGQTSGDLPARLVTFDTAPVVTLEQMSDEKRAELNERYCAVPPMGRFGEGRW